MSHLRPAISTPSGQSADGTSVVGGPSSLERRHRADVYPVNWKAFSVGQDAAIDWTASKDRAEARLDAGTAAIVTLRRNPGMAGDPTIITNLRYFGAPRNSGFHLMPNEIEAYRRGPRPFEYQGTNGFMITFDITAKDLTS